MNSLGVAGTDQDGEGSVVCGSLERLSNLNKVSTTPASKRQKSQQRSTMSTIAESLPSTPLPSGSTFSAAVFCCRSPGRFRSLPFVCRVIRLGETIVALTNRMMCFGVWLGQPQSQSGFGPSGDFFSSTFPSVLSSAMGLYAFATYAGFCVFLRTTVLGWRKGVW